ncbi:uncharacterized protein LOC123663838 [Melitaea cinxia]|uniref:uncharacterized protein LOC123663838 n=1 Tax=Melitaea cinxia TaxID=113334 RepID=UPI001E270320|nr:uncharacterized protein LOC123663838 [Melitaea cinxia]
MARTKFCGSTSRLLLLSVPAFIMLSGAVVTEKARNCYWCGPLADQVHRSQRAPPCKAADNHVTACDPDMPFCAVIATSPPYVESRLCVKLYQDECYPLFCNSTKTWKMTCPCRGELCNGPNTEREDEAFAVLAKLVTKTRNTRIKKRTHLTTSKFTPTGVEKTLIITNMSALENEELNNLNSNVTNKDQITHIMLSDEPVSNLQNMKSEGMSSLEIASTSDTVKEFATSTPAVEIGTIIDHNTLAEKEVTSGPETTKHEKLINNIVKPSEVLPAAEALQQNTTPKVVSDKVTVQTNASFEATDQTTTESDIETTTMKYDDKKNGGYKVCTTTYLMSLSVITLYVYFNKYAPSYLH